MCVKRIFRSFIRASKNLPFFRKPLFSPFPLLPSTTEMTKGGFSASPSSSSSSSFLLFFFSQLECMLLAPINQTSKSHLSVKWKGGRGKGKEAPLLFLLHFPQRFFPYCFGGNCSFLTQIVLAKLISASCVLFSKSTKFLFFVIILSDRPFLLP